MTTQRLLAWAVWALTTGLVVSVCVLLWRHLAPGETRVWALLITSAIGVVLLGLYLRWLGPRLHVEDQPRWRISPREASTLLPVSVGLFVILAGVASSDSVLAWLGAVVAGAFWAVVVKKGLARLDSRGDGSGVAQR